MVELVFDFLQLVLGLLKGKTNCLEHLLKGIVINLHTNHWLDSNHPIRYFPAHCATLPVIF